MALQSLLKRHLSRALLGSAIVSLMQQLTFFETNQLWGA